MALDAAHRSSIYQKLVPLLGDDDANALMSEFPAIEAQELVTKDFLRAELAVTRTELRGEMAQLRDELRSDMTLLRDELRRETGERKADGLALRDEISRLETRLTIRLGSAIAASTALLTAIGVFT